jgi:hypothetical protein
LQQQTLGNGHPLEVAEAAFSATGQKFFSDDSRTTAAEDDSKLIRLADSLLSEGRSAKWNLAREWALNIEFFQDRQWSTWDERERRIDPTPQRKHAYMPRLMINLFKPTLITASSRFLSTHPVIYVRAGSHDQPVIESARVAQRVVGEHEWRRQGMETVLAQSVPTCLLAGTSIWKVEWDPRDPGSKYLGEAPIFKLDDAGEPIPEFEPDPLTGEMTQALQADGVPAFELELDENGLPMMEDAWEGNIRTSHVDPQDFFIDPTATCIEDAMWCMHVTHRSPAWVFERYGVRVQPDGDASHDSARLTVAPHARQADEQKTVAVKEVWIRRGRYPTGTAPDDEAEFPTGYVYTVAGDRLLEKRPNPYKGRIFRGRPGPFIVIPCIRTPRRFWGDTFFNSLRWLQVSLNKTISTIAHNNDLTGNSQWLYSVNNEITEAHRTNEPGAWIPWTATNNPHETPTKIPGTGASPAQLRFIEILTGFFESISGQHEGGIAGGVPPNVEAGVALEALAERDTSRLAATALEIGRGITEWAQMTLALIHQFWDQPRTVAVAGRFMESEVYEFSGVDVHDSFDVLVVRDSVMPASKAARFQKAVTLWSAGLIPDPREVLRRIGEDEMEELTLDQVQVNCARNENLEARTAGAISTLVEQMSLEDASLHLPEHLRALMSPEFHPSRNPRGWVALYDHIQNHVQIQAMQFKQMQAMQAGPQPPGEDEEESGNGEEQGPPAQEPPPSAGEGSFA